MELEDRLIKNRLPPVLKSKVIHVGQDSRFLVLVVRTLNKINVIFLIRFPTQTRAFETTPKVFETCNNFFPLIISRLKEKKSLSFALEIVK